LILGPEIGEVVVSEGTGLRISTLEASTEAEFSFSGIILSWLSVFVKGTDLEAVGNVDAV
jgi:hypothetical protein